MADRLSVRLSRLWDVGDRDIPTIAKTTRVALSKIETVGDSGNLASAFTAVEELGSQFSEAVGWYRTTLRVSASRLDHAANAVKAVVADYATTDVELSEDLTRQIGEFIELRPEHAP